MTGRPRSFRVRLAVRFGGALGVTVLLACAGAYAALRRTLYERLDAVVVRLASIEAEAMTDSPDESVHFHDAVFIQPPAGTDTSLSRFAEVWTLTGAPVIRTANLVGQHLPLSAEVRERVADTNRPELFTVDFNQRRHRSALYPLGLLGARHRTHLLQVAVSTAETDATLGRFAVLLAVLAAAGFVAGGMLGWWLAGFALRPVMAIIDESERMDASGHGHRITVEADSWEMHRLIAVLNGLLRRIDSVLKSQRQFLADAGHAIKTPMTVLRGDVDVTLRKEREPDQYREVLAQVREDLRTVSALADDLITLARNDATAPAKTSVAAVDAVIEAVLRRFEPVASRSGAVLEARGATGESARIDPEVLERALNNVVDNAVKYSGASRIEVVTRDHPNGQIEVLVRDNGCGIPEDEQARVFDRFYRGGAGRARTGSGLGLPIARALLTAAGGTVTLESREGSGTAVRLTVPGVAAT